MPSRLSLHSEPYSMGGNIGENFRKLLGAPGLNPLQTAVRESVQNIADAARIGTGPEILFRLRTLTPSQMQAMRDEVFATLPRSLESRDALNRFLTSARPLVLEICDFGTTGLGGPTRADRVPVNVSSTDFVDFLRNIGTPRNSGQGGGTYGFGKASLYRMSRCSTILVDTLVAEGGDDARRLIGCHVGPSFSVRDGDMMRRFTGRHWWGSSAEDGFSDPLTGNEAAGLSAALGVTPRPEGRSGTSIMILDYDLAEDEEPLVAGAQIVEAMLWNFWPRLTEDVPRSRRFTCSVEVEGRILEVPRPEDFPPLDLFARALRGARMKAGTDVREIRSQRPSKLLGHLSIERGMRGARSHLVPADSVVPAVSRHIALMRPVELVVKYLEGTALPDERLEWAGVFIANSEKEVEEAFADAEPPAHDDWIPDNLPKGPAKTFVNVALRELRTHAFETGNGQRGQLTGGGGGAPLARLAGRLGSVLDGTAGDGAGRRLGRGGSKRPSRARATRPEFLRLEQDPGGVVAVFSTEVIQDTRRSGMTLSARAGIAVDGDSVANDADFGDPLVLSLYGEDMSADGDTLAVNGQDGTIEIRVRMPHDAAIVVNVELLAGEVS